jgi:hypothetical protein
MRGWIAGAVPRVYNQAVDFCPLLYRLKSGRRYLIWISNERDSVAVDKEGRVLAFKSAASLRRYADLNLISLKKETPILHDLDWVAIWTESPDKPVDCPKALAAWNLFSDVAVSIGARGRGIQSTGCQAREDLPETLLGK